MIMSTYGVRALSEAMPSLDLGLMFRHIHIHALRGRLSLQRMENILGKKLDVPTGDGGLLAERWLGFYPEKSIVSELSRTSRNRITLL